MADNTPVVSPKIGVNIGSQTALGGLAAAWVTFLTAAVSAGSDFYTDNGVVALFVTALAGTMAFFGGRSYQFRSAVTSGATALDRVIKNYEELMAKYQLLLADPEIDDVVKDIEAGQQDPMKDLEDEVLVTEDPSNEHTDTAAPPN